MEIYLTAIIKSKPEHATDVIQVLENMVTQTRKETACIHYDLHQSIGRQKPVCVLLNMGKPTRIGFAQPAALYTGGSL